MKPKTLNLKAFGWHIYVSRERLRFAPVSNRRGNGLARRLREIRNQRFHRTHGCCESCGKPGEKESMQLHHIFPFYEFPNLAQKKWNLLLLCPRCHFLAHHNLVLQMELMRCVARRRNINLDREFNHASAILWKEKQEGKGVAL